MKRSVLLVAWALLGLLTVSAVLISLGKRETVADPRVDSYGPSGLSAFADLLGENGYSVANTSAAYPALKQGDVVVAVFNERHPEAFEDSSVGAYRVLNEFTKRGGKVLLLPYEENFADASKKLMPVSVINAGSGKRLQVYMRQVWSDSGQYLLPRDVVTVNVWGREGDSNPSFANLTRFGKGTVATIADGYLASNRFIDRNQNADVLMNLVAAIAPKGSRIVFTEATYEKVEPDLISVLGPGAAGAWYQSLFLFVVVIFTLGRRFGLPDEVRARQTGQRDLIDAIADTYKRAKSTRVACRAAYDRADLDVRKALKLSADAPASERDERLPPALALELRRVFEGTIDPLPAQEAYERCRALRRQVKAFLHRG